MIAYVLMFGLCVAVIVAIVLAAILLARYDQHRRRVDEADWERHEAEALAVANEPSLRRAAEQSYRHFRTAGLSMYEAMRAVNAIDDRYIEHAADRLRADLDDDTATEAWINDIKGND